MIEQLEKLPDIDFVDNADLEKIENQMVEDYCEKYMELEGEEADLERSDPITLVLYACAVQIYQMYLHIDRAGKMNLLKYSFGPYLDNVASLFGIEREKAKSSNVTVRFTLSEAQSGATAIPAGTRVTDGGKYFKTDAYAEIKAGELYADVLCSAMEQGSESNGISIGAIKTLVDPIPYMQDVSNINVSDGGSDEESDDSLRERVYISPSRYSTAGTEEAYEYWVKTYNQDITDAIVYSSEPGTVNIAFLVNGGIPSESMINGLTSYITDKKIKPITDKVVISAPGTVDYGIKLKYFINNSDRDAAATIQRNISAAVDDFVKWQGSKIGRDINSSELIMRLIKAGAKRVEIESPVYQKVPTTSVAHLSGSPSVTYGGMEDD